MKCITYFAFLLLFPVLLMSQKPVLYYKCGNYLRLGDLGLVSNKAGIKVEGATIFENPDSPDTLILVPSSSMISLSGISKHTKLDTTLWLKVVKPPFPQIAITHNGKIVTGNKDIPVDEQDEKTHLILEFITDSAFAVQCPKDGYFFYGGSSYFQHGLGQPLSRPLFPGREPSKSVVFNYGGKKNNTWFVLEKIIRVNIEGKKVVERVPEQYRIIKFRKD